MMWTTLQRSKLTEQLWGWTGGSGPTLLLIHGVGMRADFWSNLIPAFEQHFSLIVVDMPGHGASPLLTNEAKTIQGYSDCIAEVLTSCTEPLLLAGHSMGALISVDLASRYSQCVQAVVVLNGVFQRTESAGAAVQQRANDLDGRSVPDSAKTLERWFGNAPVGVNAEAALRCQSWLSTIDPLGYQQAYRTFAYDKGASEESVQGIDCPALFATGELEPNSTPEMSEAMARIAPHGECEIIEGAKHMMSMTHGEQVRDMMISFFNRTGALQ